MFFLVGGVFGQLTGAKGSCLASGLLACDTDSSRPLLDHGRKAQVAEQDGREYDQVPSLGLYVPHRIAIPVRYPDAAEHLDVLGKWVDPEGTRVWTSHGCMHCTWEICQLHDTINMSDRAKLAGGHTFIHTSSQDNSPVCFIEVPNPALRIRHPSCPHCLALTLWWCVLCVVDCGVDLHDLHLPGGHLVRGLPVHLRPRCQRKPLPTSLS